MHRFAHFIIHYELLWLALLTPFLFFPGSGRGIVIVLLPLLWLCRRIALRRFVPRTPLDWPLLLLLLMVGVSLWATFDPPYSFPKVTGVLLGVAVYYALAEKASSERAVLLAVGALLGVSSAIAGISLFTTNWTNKFPLFADAVRFLPGYVLALPGSPPDGFNPNGVAGALLFSVPLALLLAWPGGKAARALAPRSLRPPVTVLLMLLALLLTGTLLLTQSRGGYLGFMAGLVALVVLPRRRMLVVTLAAITVVATVLYIVGPEPLERYFSEVDSEGTGATVTTAVDSLQGRIEIWSRALYGIQDFPLTGMGMGTFRRIVPVLYPLFTIAPDTDIGHAHNHLLAAAVDLGIPGLVAYLSTWLGVALMLRQIWRSSLPVEERMIALGLAAGLVGQFTWAMTDSNVLGSKAGFPFWLVLGAVALLHRRAALRPTAVQQGAPGTDAVVTYGA